MIAKVKIYLITALVFFVLGLVLGLSLSRCSGPESPKAVSSVDSQVAKHDVTTIAPIKALDKAELAKRGIIPKSAIRNPQSEVLATATVKDIGGTRHIAEVLDTKTGESILVDRRPLAELMHSNEFGAGFTAGSLGAGYGLDYRKTFARIWKFYPDVRLQGWQWTSGPRLSDGHRYDGQASAFLTLRW